MIGISFFSQIFLSEFNPSFVRLFLLKNGINDLTPQEISTKLFGHSEGERRKKLLEWVTQMKSSMNLLKSKAHKFNENGNSTGKSNALIAIREFKQLENERKQMIEITKDKWHPLPEVADHEIVFKKDKVEFEESK